MALDAARTLAFVQKTWDGDILPTLTEYVAIPAKSPPQYSCQLLWVGSFRFDEEDGLSLPVFPL